MAETSYIIENGRRKDLKDAAARKSIAELYQLVGSGGGGGGGADLSGYYTKTETDDKIADAIEQIELTPGPAGPAGSDGRDGSDGKDGVSATHSWNGTVLTVTSASGTSSADLKGEKGDTGTFDSSALSAYALKADIATTKSVGSATSATSYFKIGDFGAWGTGNWTAKGFSMLITSRAGEMIWVTVAANDSNTDARAIRLMNRYSKIANVYYSVSESAIYVKCAAWCNNVCAHILSNVYGDYVPTVATVSGLASDCVEINIVEFGINATSAVVGDSSVLLELGGSADRPTYNGNAMALQSDVPTDTNTTYTLTKSGTTITLTGSDGSTTSVTDADNNTTYSAGTGISLSGTTFSNSGVRSVATGSANGTISVNTNGASANVAVKGLGSAAYTDSTAYATSSHSHSEYMPKSGGKWDGPIAFQDSSLPQKNLQFLCGIDSFAAGGQMGWQETSAVLADCLKKSGDTMNGRLYTNEWIQFNGATGLFFPSQENTHFMQNTVSTYAPLRVTGNRTSYTGFLLGDDSTGLNVMSNADHQGLYNESNGRWIIYYNRPNNKMSIGGATLTDSLLNIEGSVSADGAVRASAFKSDASDSAIRASDSNEINFGSNGNVLFFGYENRVGSPGRVDTYRFGTHSGGEGSSSGRIECGTVVEGGTALSDKYATKAELESAVSGGAVAMSTATIRSICT